MILPGSLSYPDSDESGQIVPYHIGSYTVPSGSDLIDLLDYNPGFISSYPTAINSSGWLVGRDLFDLPPYPPGSVGPNYLTQAFLARPVPESSNMLLLRLGLFGVVG
jgi:hypothetical protein